MLRQHPGAHGAGYALICKHAGQGWLPGGAQRVPGRVLTLRPCCAAPQVQPKGEEAAAETNSNATEAAQQCNVAEKLTAEDMADLLRVTPKCLATGERRCGIPAGVVYMFRLLRRMWHKRG